MGAVDEMAGRVAELWRSQGEGFLERHHALVADDVARLRGAVVIGEDAEHDDGTSEWHEKVSSAFARMRGWDDAVVDKLRRNREEELIGQSEWEARKAAAVIDLTGPEPVVTVPVAPKAKPARTPRIVKTGKVVAARKVATARQVATAPDIDLTAIAGVNLETTCKRCGEIYERERLVYPHGEHKPPLCVACARQVAGFRPRSPRLR
jgi:hypothetical protein